MRYVEDTGTGEPGLLLVHGFTGSCMDWEPVTPTLATRRRVVAFDHRGHGKTDAGKPEDYTFAQLREDIREVADERGLDRFDLLGHSMGGIASQLFTLAYPERIRSLILMDTMPGPARGIPKEYLDAAANAARDKGMGGVVEMMGTLLQDRHADRMRAMDPNAFILLGHALYDTPSLLDQLPTIACPTTVIVGENDTGLRGASEEMAAAIPGAVLVVIENAAHSPQEENTRAWLEAVEAHLDRAAG